MQAKDGQEWFTTSVEFEIAARDEAAAQRRVLALSSELVQRYGLAREPIVKVEPARETVPM